MLSTAKLLGGRKETSVDVLHMDVQGAEASVLKDMAEWLRDGKARYACGASVARATRRMRHCFYSRNSE